MYLMGLNPTDKTIPIDVSIGMVVSVGLKPIRSIAASESDMNAVSSRYHH